MFLTILHPIKDRLNANAEPTNVLMCHGPPLIVYFRLCPDDGTLDRLRLSRLIFQQKSETVSSAGHVSLGLLRESWYPVRSKHLAIWWS
jgi:hypothetical protein